VPKKYSDFKTSLESVDTVAGENTKDFDLQ
jgi:hypothetical protein